MRRYFLENAKGEMLSTFLDAYGDDATDDDLAEWASQEAEEATIYGEDAGMLLAELCHCNAIDRHALAEIVGIIEEAYREEIVREVTQAQQITIFE